jgi:signal transduction histidine kinase/ligand-binding sensor domain-containing protein/DNA-binding response OmpR family regulator
MKRITFLAITFFVCLYTLSFNRQNVTFHKFPLNEMLPGSSVKRVFQDHRGFIWFGTESGICRYDGYNLLIIKSDIEHPNLLTSGNILCIEQDKHKRIWFGTDRGVNVVDENNRIVTVIQDQKIQNLRINSIVCDSQNNVWIGSENGLFLYKDDKTPIKSFYHRNDASSIPSNNINCILEDKNGNIWIALWQDGLCRYDKQSQQFVLMPKLGIENNPFVLFEDAKGILWVGSWSDGLFRLNIDNKFNVVDFKQFKTSGTGAALARNFIYSIAEDESSNDLWILSHGGIRIMSENYGNKFQDINAFEIFENASNYLNHLYHDKQGNIWIATLNDGLYIANLHKPVLNTNVLTELKKKSGYIDVYTMIENENEIWLGLRNFGVYIVDKHENLKVKGLLPADHPLMLKSIRCFSHDNSDNTIWIGGNNLLAKYNLTSKSLVPIPERIQNFIGKGNTNISAILCDSKKNTWLASRKGLIRIAANKIDLISGEFNNLHTIVEDKNGNIWAGSPSKGIIKIAKNNSNKPEITIYNIWNKTINSDEINTIYVDSNQQLWVGTNNGGLNKYSEQEDKFKSFNAIFQILDPDIKSINEDKNGNLWLSTNNKIIKINQASKTSILFSSNDISQTNYYKPGATIKDKTGKLYFGGGNGYVYFSPNLKRDSIQPNDLLVTDIRIDNKSIFQNLDKVNFDSRQHQLKLNYKQRNIGLEFSALNYTSPSNINYAYRLKGVDKDWVYVDAKRRYVNYNNLPKGNYTFEVKSTNENGVWTNKIYKLNIEVEPAPYETWWAYLLYFVLVTSILVVVFRTVRNRIRLKRDLLISKIKQEKTEELTHLKLKYFTNISHELLTPLTIISCLIEDFHQNFPNKFKQYSIMKSNITRLKRLLQQILDFRKVESGNMKLHVSRGELVGFIQEACVNNFEPLAKKKNINFIITGQTKISAFFDTDKMDKILFNILSNAFKYTPEQGTIELNIQSVLKNDIQYVKIFVNDTGTGIDPERLPYIFDRFIGNDAHYDSNGIGLSLTKELVEIHKGNISVESQVNVGTCFVVELPIDGSFYTEQEIAEKVEKIKTDAEILLALNDESDSTVAIPEKSITTKSNKTVLIVEDNPDLLMVLTGSLSRFYSVIQATNGEEALAKLNENEIDLVVSDVMMPVMDGLTLCKKIKENLEISHTPVLLLTAKNQIEDRIESYNAGADAYISKPFDMTVLIARLNSLLFNRQKRNQEFQSSLTIHPKNYENNSIDDQFLRDAIKVVEDNLENFEFTHEQLIDAMNTSKSTLYRKIKSLTGLAPSDFVRNIRLKHACLMLQSDTGNISDIAYAVGFNDPKYFSTCFKAEFGLTPREYIKRKRPGAVEEINSTT